MYDDRSSSHAAAATPPAPAPATRSARERRSAARQAQAQELRAGLTPEQLRAMETLEAFHWRLAFVRRPLFRDPIPVMFDRGDTRFVVIEGDGTLDENPTLKLRG